MTIFTSPNSNWNFPEPLEEFDGELHQPLFEIPDDEDHELRWRLKIDELVASVADTTADERVEISDLLWDFCYRQTRRWSWLKEKSWTADSLRLFIEFLVCWQGNPEWWEASFCNGLGEWRMQWNRYNLSMDNCYDLIQKRLDCPPEQVIEPEWFDDWQQYGLWMRGFPTFAAYALFRSEFDEGESWQRYIDWQMYTEADDTDAARDDTSDYAITGEKGFPIGGARDAANGHIPELQAAYHCTLANWFIQQNWYDPAEWHDNLGWDVVSKLKS